MAVAQQSTSDGTQPDALSRAQVDGPQKSDGSVRVECSALIVLSVSAFGTGREDALLVFVVAMFAECALGELEMAWAIAVT